MSVVTIHDTSQMDGVDHPIALALRRYRICVISDDLSGNLDEGAKKFTVALATHWERYHDVEIITTRGPASVQRIRSIPAPRSFVSRQLRSEIRRCEPDLVVYASRQSATFLSFIRSRLLKLYASNAPTVMLGLQTRRHPRWQQMVIQRLKPDLIGVQSQQNQRYLECLGCRVHLMASGVDIERFRPVDAQAKQQLRERYGLAVDRPTVVHVGHLVEGRNIRVLADLASDGQTQVVLVTSTSTQREEQLAWELSSMGACIISDFIPQIEELYQLADAYLFPVVSTDNAIEVPLSVLEALACDVPVISTRFGGLTRLFDGQHGTGMVFVDSTTDLIPETQRVLRERPTGMREMALSFSWDRVADDVLRHALSHEDVDHR